MRPGLWGRAAAGEVGCGSRGTAEAAGPRPRRRVRTPPPRRFATPGPARWVGLPGGTESRSYGSGSRQWSPWELQGPASGSPAAAEGLTGATGMFWGMGGHTGVDSPGAPHRCWTEVLCSLLGAGRLDSCPPPQQGGPPCLQRWARLSCRSRGGQLGGGLREGVSLGRGSRGGAGLRSRLLPVLCSVSRLPPSLLAYCATLRPRTRFSGFSSPVPRIPLGRSRSCTGQVMRTVGGHYAPWTVFLFPNTAGRRANLTQPWPAEVTEILVPCHAFLALGEDSPGAERRDRSPHPGLACLSWGVPSWRARGQLFLLCSLTPFLRALHS